MKHSLKITIILVATFLLSQLAGLLVVSSYIDYEITTPEAREAGEVSFKPLPYDIERPEVENQSAFWLIVAAVGAGTLIVLGIIKMGLFRLWKFWFFLSVWVTLTIALRAFIADTAALLIALGLSLWKILRPHILIHNITEIFIYGGLAAIFVPLLSITWAFLLLMAISIYDMWAVWHTKHMVTLATFQAKANLFAGLFIPYQKKDSQIKSIHPPSLKSMPQKPAKKPAANARNAVLGGGDIGFPLIFSGVVMKTFGAGALLVTLSSTLALLFLFIIAKDNKFYPAMPFLTTGCAAGYLMLLLV